MIGSNSTAALTFHDAKSAGEILSALHARVHVTRACIYDSDGKVFATYSRDPGQGAFTPPQMRSEVDMVDGQNVVLFHRVALNGESIGTIYIQADTQDLQERLHRFVLIDLIVLLSSLAVAGLLSYRLQRVISGPIQELAETASLVSEHKNYAIRATKKSDDEIGVLYDQFNGMLDRIQQRDDAVQKAHDELERRVQERTAFLNALIKARLPFWFWIPRSACNFAIEPSNICFRDF